MIIQYNNYNNKSILKKINMKNVKNLIMQFIKLYNQ